MASVLVIDDEVGIRQLVKTFLEREGHRVIEAENGKVGVRLFREHNPDCVITDLFMPEQEGIETIKEIMRIAPGTRVVAMSGGGRHGIDMLGVAQELGASEILRKPFHRSDLLKVLELSLVP